MAKRLLAAIEASDAEVTSLANLANASEIDRLTAQLATLGDSSHGDGGRGELQTLVQRQLDVVRRMRDQSELLSQRRARQFNLMRGLWTQLSVLRDGTAEASAAMERLHALLAEAASDLDS